MPETNEFESLTQLVRASQAPQRPGENGRPFVIVPPGHQLAHVEALLERPTRKTGAPQFTRAASFCGYVNEQKTLDSRLYVTGPTTMVAVLNHHGSDPDWKDHSALYVLTITPEWALWKAKSNVKMSQREFALFIEDNMEDIGTPSGADLLDMIRTIRASQALECTGEIDERGDTKATGFVVAAKTKAGAKQELELPAGFLIGVSPYEGGEPITVIARLRVEIQGTRLVLWYELAKVQQIEKRALEDIVATVAEETEMEAWYGLP